MEFVFIHCSWQPAGPNTGSTGAARSAYLMVIHGGMYIIALIQIQPKLTDTMPPAASCKLCHLLTLRIIQQAVIRRQPYLKSLQPGGGAMMQYTLHNDVC
jgi:hypothetical protein